LAGNQVVEKFAMASVASPVLFYLFGGLAVFGGVLVITRRNAVYSALALMGTLLAVAGLDSTLNAPFVAGVEIIVYAGGIVLLLLFAVMTLYHARPGSDRQFNRLWLLGLAASCALLASFLYALAKSKVLFPDRMMTLLTSSNVQDIAKVLYGESGRVGEYTLVFEVASLLLLAAIAGAVVMTKKKEYPATNPATGPATVLTTDLRTND
jgi:NADH-quinone oxidoreductase subunit J